MHSVLEQPTHSHPEGTVLLLQRSAGVGTHLQVPRHARRHHLAGRRLQDMWQHVSIGIDVPEQSDYKK